MTFKSGEDIVVSDFIIQIEAGETLTTRDAVYISESDGKAYKCDADDLAKIGFAGFVVEGVASAATVNVQTRGHMGGFSSLTIGSIQYVSGTAGELTETKPTNFKFVGKALTATIVEITQELTVRVRTYTADATWTKPAGLIKALFKVQAAGGGSGAAANAMTCSGAGGGYTEGLFYAGELGATEALQVGLGGAGGVEGGTNDGSVGEDSSVGTLLIADGGGASTRNGSTASGGGVTTAGYFEIDGGDGNDPFDNDNGSTTAGFFMPPAGQSHLSVWTVGTDESGDDRDYAGPTGKGYGYGGRCLGQDSQPSGINGQDGGDGIIIVTEWY